MESVVATILKNAARFDRNWCVCVCIYLCIKLYSYIYIYIYTDVYVQCYLNLYVCMYIYMRIPLYVWYMILLYYRTMSWLLGEWRDVSPSFTTWAHDHGLSQGVLLTTLNDDSGWIWMEKYVDHLHYIISCPLPPRQVPHCLPQILPSLPYDARIVRERAASIKRVSCHLYWSTQWSSPTWNLDSSSFAKWVNMFYRFKLGPTLERVPFQSPKKYVYILYIYKLSTLSKTISLPLKIGLPKKERGVF